MEWSELHQLRHAAQCSGLRSLRDRRRESVLEVERKLRYLGYDGLIGMSAEGIVRAWKENGWIELSPSGWELRLSDAGLEQFAKWDLEDALWERGETEEIKVAKRLRWGSLR